LQVIIVGNILLTYPLIIYIDRQTTEEEMRSWQAGGLCLVIAATAWAYNPKPVQRSEAEQQVLAALEQAATDSAKLIVAQVTLETHGEDIPAARAAQDVILRLKDDPIAFFKEQANNSASIPAHYLYGRAADDTVIMAEQARWILQHDSSNFWGLMQAGEAEWNKKQPNLKLVQRRFEEAVAADPSRPEGYLYLGYLFEDKEQWKDARAALDAGAVCDPQNKTIRDQRLTAAAELRDAPEYFRLMQGAFPDQPLSMDLPRANGSGRVTTDDLKGRATVIEYWAYT
jgi:hypothetical protein